jgi:hypothetical protein
MADLLANQAMDERRTSTGPTGPGPTTNALYDLIANDTSHATNTTDRTFDLIHYLESQLEHERARVTHETYQLHP